MAEISTSAAPRGEAVAAILVVAVQLLAAAYFVIDALRESRTGAALGLLDLLVGCALVAGVVYGTLTVRRLSLRADRNERALSIARGALTDLIRARFGDWGLSRSEADVAMFALKGCSITEIAELRGSSGGTVRSQLSSVYAKAGVTGQPMLMSLFLDDLLGSGIAGSAP